MRASSAAIVALLVLTTPSWAAEPTGEWLVAKRYAKINIVNCDGRLWGIVAWEARTGGVDRNNKDPAKRARPTLGMPILLGMKPTQRNRWEGEIYNAEDGELYSANISLLDQDTLKVQGCVMGFLCGGENWTRVQPEPRTSTAPKAAEPRPAAAKPAPARDAKNQTPELPQTAVEVCSSIANASLLKHR